MLGKIKLLNVNVEEEMDVCDECLKEIDSGTYEVIKVLKVTKRCDWCGKKMLDPYTKADMEAEKEAERKRMERRERSAEGGEGMQ